MMLNSVCQLCAAAIFITSLTKKKFLKKICDFNTQLFIEPNYMCTLSANVYFVFIFVFFSYKLVCIPLYIDQVHAAVKKQQIGGENVTSFSLESQRYNLPLAYKKIHLSNWTAIWGKQILSYMLHKCSV